MRKRLLAMLMAASIAVPLFGCAGDPSSSAEGAEQDTGDQTLKIGLSLDKRDQFTTAVAEAATEKAEELGVEINTFDANNDFATQLSHVETFAADNYDATVVKLINTDGAEEIIAAAGDMPVVFVNMLADEKLFQKGKVMHVGSDEQYAGALQAEWVANYADENNMDTVRAVIFMGTLGHSTTVMRTEAFKNELTEKYGKKLDIVYEDTAEWDRAKAMDKFVQFMGTGKEYDVVVCNNDDMALGVVEAMKTSGERKVVCPVFGVDATNIGCQSIQDGELAFTVYQSVVGQGGGALACAVALAKGEEPPETEKAKLNDAGTILWVDFEPVDKTNVDEYIS